MYVRDYEGRHLSCALFDEYQFDELSAIIDDLARVSAVDTSSDVAAIAARLATLLRSAGS